MDVDEADDDEYEVVGYGGGSPRAAAQSLATPTRRASDADAARVPSTSARKAPVGFDWDEDEDEDEEDEGRADEGREGRALAFDLARAVEGGGFATRGRGVEDALDDAVDEIIDDDDDERVEATPPRRAMDASALETTPRRSPRLRAAAREAEEASMRGAGTPSPGTAARDAAVLAEALGVSVERAAAAAKKMRASKGDDARDGAGVGRREKSRARAKTNANGKSKARAATSPRHAAKRAKTNANANVAPRGVLGRLNLLTQSTAVRATTTDGVANVAERETTRGAAATHAATTNDAVTVEDDIAVDDIDDDGVSSSGKSGGGGDEVPCTLGQENVDVPGGLGALSRLPKMSSPTFMPRSSVSASLATQRNRSRNAGSLTNRLQHVLQNAHAAHAQFAKRVAQSQPPSSRGALHFTVNASRLDASLTNCAGAICDLHRATSDDFDRTDLEYSRAIVIFTSAQAQELSLERGRQVAIYPPWREVDLPGRVNETTSTVDDTVPRVILCAENVLRLN